MKRHCNGEDPNLGMYVNLKTGERSDQDPITTDHVMKPCDCGKVFDDVRYSTIYPHRSIK